MASRPLAVITGASSGIGAAFARKLAPTYDLLLVARRKERLDQLAAELGNTDTEVLQADLSGPADQTALAQRLAEDPRLALLVNCAGFGSKGCFWEAPLESQESMHQVQVMATVRLSHAALSNLVPRNSGAIINVSSIAAFFRSPGNASYSATKCWMAVFTEAIHVELRARKSQVKVQALCPGYTYSEFHDALGLDRHRLAPSRFWMTAEQVVDASLSALGTGKLYVIPGWRNRLLSAAFSILPARLRLKAESYPRPTGSCT